VGVFWSLLNKLVIWRAPHSDQLGQCSEWFGMNPFVSKVILHSNEIRIYNSPSINISVLSPGRVASREAHCLIYDEMGWCFNHLALYEYYKASRPMIAASNFKHILHASTPARNTVFREEWEALEGLERTHNTKFLSIHTWRDCHWISKEWVESERLRNFDCPWYVEQNYECEWVVYGGAVFNNYIWLGDPRYPNFPIDYFDKFKKRNGTYYTTHGGVDFNGEIVGHYLDKIVYDDNYVYIIEEIIFRDLNDLTALNLWDIDNPFSLEIEDGLFNIPFARDCRRLGIPAIYKQWGGKKGRSSEMIKRNEESDKMERIAELKKRTIIIDRITCPLTYRNIQEAAYDQNSRLPKLEKRTDQHGLDALLHAIHESGAKIHFRDRSPKKNIFGRTYIYNPIQHI